MKKFLIILIIIICGIYFLKPQIIQKIYPREYQEYVEEAAKENNIDELLIYSIIKGESGFKQNVKSSSGAIGLMQIMITTAKEISEELGISDLGEEKLYEPEINIKIGTKYFAKLIKEYNNNLNLAIIAYNAGMGNVNKWLDEGRLNEYGTNIEDIPFSETRNYVKKILQNYEVYKEIY